jgi:hypothetical protein
LLDKALMKTFSVLRNVRSYVEIYESCLRRLHEQIFPGFLLICFTISTII